MTRGGKSKPFQIILRLVLLSLICFSQPNESSAIGDGLWRQGNFEIYIFDVGQADSQLIVSPTAKTILIDLGEVPYTIPRGTKIPANGYFVWKTQNYFNNSRDGAVLYDKEGNTIDVFGYTRTICNESWARIPNGGAWSRTMRVNPTMGRANR